MVQVPKTIRLPHDVYGERPFDSHETAEAIWELLLNERSRGSIELLAACLMPDHLHALVSPRGRDIIKWVDGFKSWSTRVAQKTRPHRILWQPGFHDRVIRDQEEFDAALRYIVDNPIAAGLVEERGQWPWVGVWVAE